MCPYFYPRSPCGERPIRRPASAGQRIISIHALLAESDGKLPVWLLFKIAFLSTLSLRRATAQDKYKDTVTEISIHALLAESDGVVCGPRCARPAFLSTLSLRRATAKVHKTVGHFCAYGTNFMGIASSC